MNNSERQWIKIFSPIILGLRFKYWIYFQSATWLKMMLRAFWRI